ncbi:hypothetical protein GUJ93_ZPchr0010g8269 [Zizania palustris]|uniref:Uncharacterized protein n=1 Tax=Zizania palustris TaxID=103762 RepID=A0A8J5W8F5_ZIZPA|nr:hypothetical protein GUJ93_ZPchr0010g8269 [Zizania palustris]
MLPWLSQSGRGTFEKGSAIPRPMGACALACRSTSLHLRFEPFGGFQFQTCRLPSSTAEALSPHSHSQASPFHSSLASMDSSPAPAAAAAALMATATPPLEDCLCLLHGEHDEQKLAGLLIAANVCRAGDVATVVEVYRAVGSRFLRRLLNTGLGKLEGGKEEEKDAYLCLAVTVLSDLARIPEVVADEGVISTIPLIAEIVSKS